MANLTSTLTVRLNDDVSGPAGRAASALHRLGASGADLKKLAAASPEAARLVRELEKLQAQADKINAFRNASKGLGAAGNDFRLARQDVARLTSELGRARAEAEALKGVRGGEDARRAAGATVRRLERDLRAANGTLDQSKGAYLAQGQAVRGLQGELSAAGVSMKGLRQAQAGIEGQIARTNAELARQPARMAQAAAKAEHLAETERRAAQALAAAAADRRKLAAASPEAGRLARELDALDGQAGKIRAFREASRGLAAVGGDYRAARQDVSRLTAELDRARVGAEALRGVRGGDGAYQAAAANVRRLEGDLHSARGALERSKVSYLAQGKAVRGLQGELAAAGIPMKGLRQAQAGIERQIRDTSAELARQPARLAEAAARAEHLAEAERRAASAARVTAAERSRAASEQLRATVAAGKAERATREEVARTHAAKRASAGRDLASGMGASGRAALDGLERDRANAATSRRMIDGMGATGRAASEARAAVEADRRAAREEARAARRAGRREAAGVMASAGAVAAGHGIKRGAHASLETYREFDKERRFGRAVMGISDAEQAPLVDQAIHMGATTKYNDVQVLEAQRELAARGLKRDQVMGLMEPAADLGQSFDLRLPDAVKQMEGAIFGFNKDISTLKTAVASAKQTADVQVKAAKISGMTPEDITQTYKYGATPARMAGLSEETLLAFAGISKKANMGGDEAGVAFRALVANVLSPTRGAKEAMLANGMDYKNYQKMPEKIDTQAFVKTVAAQYGVKLDKATTAGLDKIFTDKNLIADPSKFTPKVMDLLSDNLAGDDAKSKKSIAGLANRFRDRSMQGVDADRMVADLMGAIAKNPAIANAIFGSKQGARIANALGNPETFKHMLDELLEHSKGYAEKIAQERMAGFDGAASRLKGAATNLETAVGRAFDDGGRGGLLTRGTDLAAKGVQGLAELDGKALVAAAGLAAAAGAVGSFAGSLRLAGMFLGLPALTALGGMAAAIGAVTLAAGAAAAALYVLSDEKKGIVHGGKPDFGMNPSDELPGLPGSNDPPSWAPQTPGLPRMSLRDGVPSLVDEQRAAMPEAIARARDELAGYRKELVAAKADAASLASMGVPGLDRDANAKVSGLEKKAAEVEARIAAMRQASGAPASLPPGASQPASRAAEGVPSLIDAPRSVNAGEIAKARQELAAFKRELDVIKAEASATSDLGLPGVGPALDGRKAELEAMVQGLQDKLRTLSETPIAPRADGSGLDPLDAKFSEITTKAGEVNGLVIRPQADGSGLGTIISQLDAVIAKAGEANAAVSGIGSPRAGAGGGGAGGANTGTVRAAQGNNH